MTKNKVAPNHGIKRTGSEASMSPEKSCAKYIFLAPPLMPGPLGGINFFQKIGEK